MRWLKGKPGRCVGCGKRSAAKPTENCRIPRHMEYYLARLKRAIELRLVYKTDVFQHYSSGICSCCGEKELSFLTIDHIEGGGTQERAKLKLGGSFYRHLINLGYPPGYQALCANCNLGKRVFGVCPHAKR